MLAKEQIIKEIFFFKELIFEIESKSEIGNDDLLRLENYRGRISAYINVLNYPGAGLPPLGSGLVGQ